MNAHPASRIAASFFRSSLTVGSMTAALSLTACGAPSDAGDAEGDHATGSPEGDEIGATEQAIQASPSVVISQIYGGGASGGATYKYDYVELYNRSNHNVRLAGWSVQYASATGNGLLGGQSTMITQLPDVTLTPGQYYLIQEAGTTATGAALPTPLFADPSPIMMSATTGKIALASVATSVGCNNTNVPCTAAQLGSIVDLVGYGPSSTLFEGTGPAPAPNATLALHRRWGGCRNPLTLQEPGDSNQNAQDLVTALPAPRTTATFPQFCGIEPSLP